MSEEISESNSEAVNLFSIFSALAYVLIAVNVLDVVAQIATGFASSQQLSASGEAVSFSQQLEFATRQVASPFAVFSAFFGILIFAALRYVQLNRQATTETSQAWFIAIAASALSAAVVIAASLYDLIKLFQNDPQFGGSVGGAAKFAYTLEWAAAIVLGGAVVFTALRVWNSSVSSSDSSEDDLADDSDEDVSAEADKTSDANTTSTSSADE